MREVAVLGGGIAGLSAAYYLRERAHVTVFERSARVGGCIDTARDDGFVLELGPDSLLVDKPAGADLLRRLHLEQTVVDMQPEFKGAMLVHSGRLRRLPPEFRLFTPMSLPALLASGIFSPRGLARAAAEPFIPPRKADGDESLASFVTRRFGREVLDRLAQPLIGGIYSGDPRRLSMQATLPQFLELERKYGSLVRAMRASRGKAVSPRLASLRDGLGSIVAALARELHDAIRTLAEAVSLRRENERWTIAFADGSTVQADAVICALPAYAAGALIADVDREMSQKLQSIHYNSIATVNLAYETDTLPALPRTTGFVVPYAERRHITAATISSQKYPARSPQDAVLLRAFIGGALQPQLLERNDDALIRMAREEFQSLLALRSDPRLAIVQRWVRLLPEYRVGHLALIEELERRAASLPQFGMAGSAYRGVGIPDCIQSGKAAAERVLGTMERI